MIQAVFTRKNSERMLEVKGHAGYSTGDDIVCAAVSTLEQTMAAVLSTDKYKPKLKKIAIEMDRGYFFIHFCPKRGEEETINAFFDYCETGFRLLSGSFGDYVDVVRIDKT